MEIIELGNVLVEGILIMPVASGIIEILKKWLKLEGAAAEALAVGVGAIIGFGYRVWEAGEGIAWDYQFIYPSVIFALAVGLSVAGLYKVIKHE